MPNDKDFCRLTPRIFVRCLLSAASHAVDHYFSMETIEKAIIEEFGQCLNKIIEKGTEKQEEPKIEKEEAK